MSNQSYVVVCVDKAEAQSLSVEEVLRRYYPLHKGTLLSHKHLKAEVLSPGELITFDETLARYRQRL